MRRQLYCAWSEEIRYVSVITDSGARAAVGSDRLTGYLSQEVRTGIYLKMFEPPTTDLAQCSAVDLR
jgi:hypothetical protein